jgi:AcrR family transcriptional regulator
VARRGRQLREHILTTAKDVFLASGYERTSMDVVAARAETSKRSLYAHFPSKDALFAGVVALARERYLENLGHPEDHDVEPTEAVVRYCGRLVQLLFWAPSLRTLRLGITESEHLPEAAAGIHDAIFEVPTTRLAAFVEARFGLAARDAREIADAMVGRALHPELTRALLGVRALVGERPQESALAGDVDLGALRDLARRLLPGTRP